MLNAVRRESLKLFGWWLHFIAGLGKLEVLDEDKIYTQRSQVRVPMSSNSYQRLLYTN